MLDGDRANSLYTAHEAQPPHCWYGEKHATPIDPLTVEVTGSYNAMVKWLMGNEPIGTLRGCRFFCSRLVVQHYFPGLHVHRIRCTRFEV
jgi:hypothetical protein